MITLCLGASSFIGRLACNYIKSRVIGSGRELLIRFNGRGEEGETIKSRIFVNLRGRRSMFTELV